MNKVNYIRFANFMAKDDVYHKIESKRVELKEVKDKIKQLLEQAKTLENQLDKLKTELGR